jgi:hypothetical protein
MEIDHIAVSDQDGKVITALEDCISCHPTGRAGEAGQFYDTQARKLGPGMWAKIAYGRMAFAGEQQVDHQ